jgi:hypothetical protein
MRFIIGVHGSYLLGLPTVQRAKVVPDRFLFNPMKNRVLPGDILVIG